MGLVEPNAVGMSGLVAAPVTVHTVTADGSTTYVMPAGSSRVYIECVGAGGGVGAGAGGLGTDSGGGGGAGGAMARGIYDAKSMPASLTIVVGAGGAVSSGGSSGTGSGGNGGGYSSVTGTNFSLTAYGGGGGGGRSPGSPGGGNGGSVIVILRIADACKPGSFAVAPGTNTTAPDGSDTVATFTVSGTLTL